MNLRRGIYLVGKILCAALLVSPLQPGVSSAVAASANFAAPTIQITHTSGAYSFAFPKVSPTYKYAVYFLDAKRKAVKSFTFFGSGVKKVSVSKNTNWPQVKINFYSRSGQLQAAKLLPLPIVKIKTPTQIPTPATLPTPTPVGTPTPMNSATPTPAPSTSPTPTSTPTPTPTSSPTPTPSPTPTESSAPSAPANPPYVAPPAPSLPTIDTVVVTGQLHVNQVLFAQLGNAAGFTTSSYLWQKSATADGTYSEISTSHHYDLILSPSLATYFIKVTVTLTNNDGTTSKTSSVYGPIAIDTPTFTISSAEETVTVSNLISASFPYAPQLYTTHSTGDPIANYFLYSGDPSLFSIDSSTGRLSILQYLNPVVATSYSIGIGARNAAGFAYTTFTLHVPLAELALAPTGGSSPFGSGLVQTISYSDAGSLTVGTPFLTVSLPELQGVSYQCGLVTGTDFLIFNNLFVLATALNVGTHTSLVICVDADSHFLTQKTFSLTVSAPTEPPVVSGISIVTVNGHSAPVVGDQLTISGDSIVSGGPVNRSYQWFRGPNPINGATNRSYTVQTADIGHVISVVETVSNTVLPNAMPSTTIGVPAVGRAPTISSVLMSNDSLDSSIHQAGIGVAINANVTYDSPDASATLSYKWYRDTGSGPTLISGQTGSSYTPTLDDLDATISLQVKVANSYGDTGFVDASNTARTYGFDYFSPASRSGNEMVLATSTLSSSNFMAIYHGDDSWISPHFALGPNQTLPTGLGLDPATGVIGGLPIPGAQPGTFTIIMTDSTVAAVQAICQVTIMVFDLSQA